ncbi:MAG: hypothetical protein ACP5K5_03770 [Candidatus Micrarchaeia archaeon]
MMKEFSYGDLTPDKNPSDQKPEQEQQEELSIAEPLSFWIGMLLLAIIIELVIVPFSGSLGVSKDTFNNIANYIIYLPGCIVMPLLVAIWLGERIGALSKGKNVAYKSIVNAIYMSIIYLVAIFIIFLVAKYTNLNLFPTLMPSLNMGNFLEYLVAIPVAILLVLTPLFAILSAARHK